MLKPARLKKNDTIALVSLSSNNISDPEFSFRFDLIEKRLKKLGLNYVFSKNALLSRAELNAHPELIAEDLVDCLKDNNIKGIICANFVLCYRKNRVVHRHLIVIIVIKCRMCAILLICPRHMPRQPSRRIAIFVVLRREFRLNIVDQIRKVFIITAF